MAKLFPLDSLKRNQKQHWDSIYKKNKPDELSWYQDYPQLSLKLIGKTGVGLDAEIIDIGGGTSKLIGILVDQGFRKLTVLDISSESIEKAKSQFGDKSKQITWIEEDITSFNPPHSFDIWHDRAVFHFLTNINDRKKYIESVIRAVNSGGHMIISTFGLEGPPKCSGIKVVRYSAESLSEEFGNNFRLVESFSEVHDTPSKVQQNFIYCRFKKI